MKEKLLRVWLVLKVVLILLLIFLFNMPSIYAKPNTYRAIVQLNEKYETVTAPTSGFKGFIVEQLDYIKLMNNVYATVDSIVNVQNNGYTGETYSQYMKRLSDSKEWAKVNVGDDKLLKQVQQDMTTVEYAPVGSVMKLQRTLNQPMIRAYVMIRAVCYEIRFNARFFYLALAAGSVIIIVCGIYLLILDKQIAEVDEYEEEEYEDEEYLRDSEESEEYDRYDEEDDI